MLKKLDDIYTMLIKNCILLQVKNTCRCFLSQYKNEIISEFYKNFIFFKTDDVTNQRSKTKRRDTSSPTRIKENIMNINVRKPVTYWENENWKILDKTLST